MKSKRKTLQSEMFKSHFEVNFHVTPKLEVNFKFNFRMISNFDFETGSGFDTKSDSNSSFFATLIPTSIPVFDLDTDSDSSFQLELVSIAFFDFDIDSDSSVFCMLSILKAKSDENNF